MKRTIGIFLCFAMLICGVPVQASAASGSIAVYHVSCDSAVYSGGTYDIVISATGTNLKYQWQGYGTKWLDLKENHMYSGTNTPHLKYNCADHNGDSSGWSTVDFRCKVTGDEGKAYSRIYNMYIYPPEQMSERLKTDPVKITSVKHSCDLPDGSEKAKEPLKLGDITAEELYINKGDEITFDFEVSELKQWMTESEITAHPYIQVIDTSSNEAAKTYDGSHVSFSSDNFKNSDFALVYLSVDLKINGNPIDYEEAKLYRVSLHNAENTDIPETTSKKISALSISDLNIPLAGQKCDTDISVSSNVSVESISWSWDKNSDGTVDERNCSVFKETGKYYCAIVLKANDGYSFATKKGRVNNIRSDVFAGIAQINGKPYKSDILCLSDGKKMILEYWSAPAVKIKSDNISKPLPEDSDISGNDPAAPGTSAPEDTNQGISAPEVSNPEAPDPVKPKLYFNDVKSSDWFYEDVSYVSESGIMNGINENNFGPYGTCTRAMVVTILYRMEGEPEISADNPFTDIAKGSWYDKAVVWAAENKIVEGMSNGQFQPDKAVSREQFAAILARYAKYKGFYDENDEVMTAGFTDSGKISSWADSAVSWAVGVGLISGSNDKDGLYLSPQKSASRCQVAAIFHRFNDQFIKK